MVDSVLLNSIKAAEVAATEAAEVMAESMSVGAESTIDGGKTDTTDVTAITSSTGVVDVGKTEITDMTAITTSTGVVDVGPNDDVLGDVKR